MKTRIILFAVLFSFLCSTVFFGCKKKDDPKDFTNADYAGTWNVSNQCNTAVSFQMTIAASGANGVVITNFHKQTYATGFTINGTVSGNTLTIPSQSSTSTSQGTYTFAGTGTLSSTTSLSIPYTISAGASSISCTSTCTK